MMTCEIRVNGTLIGHLYLRNSGFRLEGVVEYGCEYYKLENGKVVHFLLQHDPKLGAEALVADAMKKVVTTLKK